MWNLLTTVQEGGQGTFVVDDVNSSVSLSVQFLKSKPSFPLLTSYSMTLMISLPAVVQWVAAAVLPRQSQGTRLSILPPFGALLIWQINI